MIKFKDFENPETGLIDWGAYHAACVEAGEECKKCGALIMTFNVFHSSAKKTESGPRLCHDCKRLKDALGESVRHEMYVRCPACGHLENVHESDQGRLSYEGEHDFMCGECDESYTIITHVSYEFESPAINEDVIKGEFDND